MQIRIFLQWKSLQRKFKWQLLEWLHIRCLWIHLSINSLSITSISFSKMIAILKYLNNIIRNNVVAKSILCNTRIQARNVHYASNSNNSKTSRRNISNCNSKENAMALKSISQQSKTCNYLKGNSGISQRMITFLRQQLFQIAKPSIKICEIVEFIEFIRYWMTFWQLIDSLLSDISILLSFHSCFLHQTNHFLLVLSTSSLSLSPLLISKIYI